MTPHTVLVMVGTTFTEHLFCSKNKIVQDRIIVRYHVTSVKV